MAATDPTANTVSNMATVMDMMVRTDTVSNMATVMDMGTVEVTETAGHNSDHKA
jgi:hypothetical protein